MNKYFLAFGFLALAIPVMAMDDKPLSESGDISSLKSMSSELPPSIDPKKIEEDVKSKPENYVPKGGIGGWLAEQVLDPEVAFRELRMVSDHYNQLQECNKALLKQLEIMQAGQQQMGAIARALEEAQKNLDKEQEAKKDLQIELEVQKRLLEFSRKEQEKLLEAHSKKDAVIILEGMRKKRLEEIISDLKRITDDFARMASEIAKLVGENEDYELTLKNLSEEELKDPENQEAKEHLEKLCAHIKGKMKENMQKISELKQKQSALEKLKIEKEATKENVEKAIQENDHYNLIMDKIHDKKVTEEDLALFMFSTMQMCGMDLDELSECRGQRIIEALIKVSRPIKPCPSGVSNSSYDGRWRFLGNAFMRPNRELSWVGEPLDMDKCRYKGSAFSQSSETVAQYAKQYLTKRK